jgi:hypothetical protein
MNFEVDRTPRGARWSSVSETLEALQELTTTVRERRGKAIVRGCGSGGRPGRGYHRRLSEG